MSQYIKEIHIQNFKKFENISLKLKPDYNILVGDNEAGKSTVLEAINLALTGLLNGKYLKNELSQHIFNKKVVKEWLESICSGAPKPLPEIIIELYFSDDVDPMLLGKNNARRENAKGVVFRIAFDERYRADYEMLISSRNVKTLPIEYYEVSCLSFANEAITPKNIPIKPALIDSAGAKFQNGSDIYVSRIVKDLLETPELVKVIQAFRGSREAFGTNSVISEINTKIQEASNISNKNVKIDIDFPSKNAWEMAVVTYLDDMPEGKGAEYDFATGNININKKQSIGLQYFIGMLLHEFTHYLYDKHREHSPVGEQKAWAVMENFVFDSPSGIQNEADLEAYKQRPFEAPAYYVQDYFEKHKFVEQLFMQITANRGKGYV